MNARRDRIRELATEGRWQDVAALEPTRYELRHLVLPKLKWKAGYEPAYAPEDRPELSTNWAGLGLMSRIAIV